MRGSDRDCCSPLQTQQLALPAHQRFRCLLAVLRERHQFGLAGNEGRIDAERGGLFVAVLPEFFETRDVLLGSAPAPAGERTRTIVIRHGEPLLQRLADAGLAPGSEKTRGGRVPVGGAFGVLGEFHHLLVGQDEIWRTIAVDGLLFPPLPEGAQNRQPAWPELAAALDPPQLILIHRFRMRGFMDEPLAGFAVPFDAVEGFEFLAQGIRERLEVVGVVAGVLLHARSERAAAPVGGLGALLEVHPEVLEDQIA
jgi:hypothetical protein